ncbi:DUF4400 domain-containing protein [Escherichia coli]|nr:DUF4400 domain-containing protein [Escherichia coli]
MMATYGGQFTLTLSWPTAVYPNLLIWPAAMLLGMAVTVTMASFKKYL